MPFGNARPQRAHIRFAGIRGRVPRPRHTLASSAALSTAIIGRAGVAGFVPPCFRGQALVVQTLLLGAHERRRRSRRRLSSQRQRGAAGGLLWWRRRRRRRRAGPHTAAVHTRAVILHGRWVEILAEVGRRVPSLLQVICVRLALEWVGAVHVHAATVVRLADGLIAAARCLPWLCLVPVLPDVVVVPPAEVLRAGGAAHGSVHVPVVERCPLLPEQLHRVRHRTHASNDNVLVIGQYEYEIGLLGCCGGAGAGGMCAHHHCRGQQHHGAGRPVARRRVRMSQRLPLGQNPAAAACREPLYRFRR
jgi:hypothetical protein